MRDVVWDFLTKHPKAFLSQVDAQDACGELDKKIAEHEKDLSDLHELRRRLQALVDSRTMPHEQKSEKKRSGSPARNRESDVWDPQTPELGFHSASSGRDPLKSGSAL